MVFDESVSVSLSLSLSLSQYRPSYVTPQQYQVASSPGFYPGTSPADYAGAYYPTQPQFTPPVAPAPVIINPAPQQQQAPPPQQQQAPPRRERKQIRIRDPNQGGRDITEEIMSGGRSGSTPTPPQPNGDNATPAVAMTTRVEFPIPPGESPIPDALPTPPPTSPISDTVDAPPPAPADDTHTTPTVVEPPASNGAEATPTTSKEEGPVTVTLLVAAPQAEPSLESPIVQPEELQLFNGVPAGSAHRDISPIAEPDVAKEALPYTADISDRMVKEIPSQVVKETPVEVKEVLAPVFKEPTPPVVKETPAPVVKEPTPPVVKETPAPVVKDMAAPVVKETPIPVIKETPAPVVKETPAPVVKETPAPVVKETPAPVVKETAAPVVKATPAPVVKATVPVVAKETPTPVDAETRQKVTQEAVVKEMHVVTETPVETPPVIEETPSLAAKETPEPLFKEATDPSEVISKATPPPMEGHEDTPTTQTTPSESSMQVVSVPKKKRKMKDLNKKEAGDLLDAFKEPTPPEPEATPPVKAEPESPAPVVPPPAEDVDETWEEKEDKLDAENIKPQSPTPSSPTEQKYQYKEDQLDAENIKPESPTPSSPTEQKYQYKEEQWKPLSPEEKKKYDREFLLGFQFISASMHKPEGLPQISDVVLDKANKTPLRQLDPSRLPGMNCGPDFTPSFANLGRPSAGGRGPPSGLSGPRRSGQGQRGKEPRKIIASVSLTEDVQLNKAEKAWKPMGKRSGRADEDEPEPDFLTTQELFKRVRSVLNKLTPQMFQPLMKQVTELTIDTEERLKGVIDLIFEKAISEPNFSVAYANMCRCLMGPSGLSGPRRSGQGQRGKEPRKIIASVSLTEDVQLNKAEKAWKPMGKRSGRADEDEPEPDFLTTQELFKRVRSVLNKLTPQMFQPLMKQVTELTIDTEERLKGVIDLIFEKAISEPNFSVAYANMCRCLMGLKVPTTDKPGVTVNFRKLLLNRCQKEFEKDKDDDETFEKKQKELDAASGEEEKQRLKEELEDAKDKARRRSLGNIKFIGELFKLKMLTETIMHDCIVKLLKNHDEESLECLCRLLSTIGKDLDFEKAKPRMDQYFNQMEKIIKERKTSSRIRFMLQDVLDLRRNNWVPRRGDLGPKTIEQIHKEAELEEHREQVKVQQQLLSKKDSRSAGAGGGGGGGGMGPRGGPHTPGSRGNQAPDDGWNTVPISTKNRPIDPTRLSKITKPGALDFNNQLLAPGGKGSWGSWGKGSSGGSGAKPSDSAQDSGRTSTLNRFSALQQPSSSSSSSSANIDSDRRAPHRSEVTHRDSGWTGTNAVCVCVVQPGALDFNNQLLAPGGKGSWGSWGKGSSGGSGAKPSDSAQDSGRTSTLNRFSALQQPSSSSSSSSANIDSDRRAPHSTNAVCVCVVQPGALDFNNQLLAPGGKGSWGSWGKGSSGGSGAKPSDSAQDSGRTSTLNRFSALQQPSSSSSSSSANIDSDRRAPHRSSSSRERSDRFERMDRNRPAVGKRSFSREKERSRDREQRPAEMLRRVSSMTDERERERSNVKRETVPTPPPASSKPELTEDELEKKSTAIIEEYLHINDMKVHTLAHAHTKITLLLEVLEVAEDMAIDIPHIWLYLAELISPMLHEGGIPMGPLFREVSKPLVPLGKAGVLLVEILKLLCKAMSLKTVGVMWRDAALSWKDFLPEDEDVNKFVTEEGVEFTLGEECVRKSSKGTLSPEDISREMERLLQEKADNQRIFDWVEASLDEQQTSSSTFVRALMTTVCQCAIICENPYKVDTKEITQRAKLLQRYIKDEQKELQALYALQSLMMQMEQPP
ncbi:eukaryotic translation initiation factor 4 gamma 1-like, partial [Sinocyclocheilus grahami]|uniref:eukaryotic translation initiation factor 4 gamma 1-like n=1 Tax=Sinocyclocheilus grahami TaxID=75366 RepID=UPI0007AD47CF